MAPGARRIQGAPPRGSIAIKRLRLEFVVLGACALLVAVLGYERNVVERQRPTSVFSTYDAGANGYLALYNVLAAAGVPVRRFERELGTLDPSIRTLVITGYEDDPSAKPLDIHDAALMRRFVLNGGRLVAIDAEFAGNLDVTPGAGTTLRAGGADAIVLARNRYTAGVVRTSGSIDWIFPFKEPRGVPLLANQQGMVAVTYRFGRGEVIAITAPTLFGNAELRNADNLRFAFNAIAGHGEVAFDEYIHGYDDHLTMWSALPPPVHAAIGLLVVIVAIALIGANVPFAPSRLPEPPGERDSSAYLSAMAELMRRSRRRPSDDDVVWQATIDFHQRKEQA